MMERKKAEIVDIAKKYESRIEFKTKACKYYSKALRINKVERGFLDKVCSHMKTLQEVRRDKTKYPKEYCAKVAKKYSQRNVFRTKDRIIYKVAHHRGFLDEICSHMKKYSRKPKTKAEIEQLARKCKTKKEFSKRHNYFYKKALEDKKFFNRICSHMECFQELRERIYIERELIPNVHNVLLSFGLEYEICQEVNLTKKSRIDIVIKVNGLIIPVEVKHDSSPWTKKELSCQIKKYDRYFSKRAGVKTMLVSPNGKYGFSEMVFLYKLYNMIEKTIA